MKFSKGFNILGKVRLVSMLLILASCQEQAFFEKEGLSEVIGPDEAITLPESDLDNGDEVADNQSNEDATNDSSEDDGAVVVTNPESPAEEEEDSSEDEVVTNPGDGSNGGENGEEEDSSEDEVTTNPDEGSGEDEDEDLVGDVGDFLETCEDISDLTTCNEETPEPGPSYMAFSEVFHQNEAEKRKVDILWVVDNSGSMRDEQEALAYNFETFINNFITMDVDFRMAITTTDARNGYRGKIVGSHEKLNSEFAKANESDFISHFKKKIMVGTRGSGHEKGLETSRALLEKDSLSSENFLRKDAYLAIVYVSDEEDQSQGDVSDYVKTFKGLKANEGLVKVYSIVKMAKDIRTYSNSSWYASYASRNQGKRYQEASVLTDGKTSSINDDFHGILNGMGETIVNLSMSFPLAKKSVDEQFEVFVNGVITESFVHDQETNSIKFDENSTPQEGAEIIVKYNVEKENEEVNLANSNSTN